MRKAIVTLAVLSMVGIASADLVVLRDLTDEIYLSPRAGVTYVGRDATGSFYNATNDGYNVLDANLYEPGGPTEGGAFLDITDDTIEIILMYDDAAGGEDLGFWLRMYAGEWDPVEEQYSYLGWANANFIVPNDGQWHTFTKAVGDFEEPFGDPALWAQIYKYRVDAVKWGAGNDFIFGLGSIPEPTSLTLLALGGLALLRRR
ncbi:MAG: PEP-CTERM sorting domain-containing protein [Phycisphaerae bacterium]